MVTQHFSKTIVFYSNLLTEHLTIWYALWSITYGNKYALSPSNNTPFFTPEKTGEYLNSSQKTFKSIFLVINLRMGRKRSKLVSFDLQNPSYLNASILKPNQTHITRQAALLLGQFTKFYIEQ